MKLLLREWLKGKVVSICKWKLLQAPVSLLTININAFSIKSFQWVLSRNGWLHFILIHCFCTMSWRYTIRIIFKVEENRNRDMGIYQQNSQLLNGWDWSLQICNWEQIFRTNNQVVCMEQLLHYQHCAHWGPTDWEFWF